MQNDKVEEYNKCTMKYFDIMTIIILLFSVISPTIYYYKKYLMDCLFNLDIFIWLMDLWGVTMVMWLVGYFLYIVVW